MKNSTTVKTLIIDGLPVSGLEGETILDVAAENGIEIPTLCHLDGLSSFEACRLCLVEISGSERLYPACSTPVEEGMQVTTCSDRLLEYRRMIIELILSERNHICSVCVSNGHCDLQAMAQKLGVDHVRFHYRNPQYAVDASHPRFVIDPNRCILCSRCVRVCGEIEGAHTLDICHHAIDALVITDFNDPWGESDTCTSCGKCVNVCPTGALSEKGKSVSEMDKRHFLPDLINRRKEVKQ